VISPLFLSIFQMFYFPVLKHSTETWFKSRQQAPSSEPCVQVLLKVVCSACRGLFDEEGKCNMKVSLHTTPHVYHGLCPHHSILLVLHTEALRSELSTPGVSGGWPAHVHASPTTHYTCTVCTDVGGFHPALHACRCLWWVASPSLLVPLPSTRHCMA
jgi:hypothetical protein